MRTVADYLPGNGGIGLGQDRPRRTVDGSIAEAMNYAEKTPSQPMVFKVSWLCRPEECEVIDGMVKVSRRVIAGSHGAATMQAGVRVTAEE